jgi:capsular polysaccharide biosynthesis protein
VELRHYLEIIGRRWWVVATAVGVTTLLTVLLVVQQPWVYGASGTFVVRPRSVDSAEVVRAIDTLIRGVEINSTYATIARSDAIRERARQRLGPDFSTAGLSVDSDVMAGTNVLVISVRGPDPESVATFATAVGEETVQYVLELEDAFELKPLDLPGVDERPVGPNKMLTVMTGILFGAMVGVAGAIGSDRLSRAVEERRGSHPSEMGWRSVIMDPPTGTFHEDYFMMRFSEEMSRSKHSGRDFAVGLLRFVVPAEALDRDHSLLLRAAADAAASWQREEDVLSHVGGETLAVLLPDLDIERANRLMDGWKADVVSRLGADLPADFSVTVGVANYTGSEDVPGGLDEFAPPSSIV